MNLKSFQSLTKPEKRTYLIDVFVQIKDICTSYAHMFNFLNGKYDIAEFHLDKIYAIVQEIKDQVHEQESIQKFESISQELYKIHNQEQQSQQQE